MKFSAAVVAAAVAAPLGGVNSAALRGTGPVPAVLGGGASVRNLAGIKDFVSLDCNVGLADVPCENWTEKIGNRTVHPDRVIVKCGECIKMDFAGPLLTLEDGIDIRGKLLFKQGYELIVNTTMVAVQGELVMFSRKRVDGTPAIKFIMTGDTDKFFKPIGPNALNCGDQKSCKAGKKAIVVAGGKVRFQGLPTDTPTWIKLHDVERVLDSSQVGAAENGYEPPPPGANCDVDGVYFGTKFSEGCGERDEFTGTPGSKFRCTPSFFEVSDRTSTQHGTQLDLKNFRHCLSEERTYLLTIQLRLTSPHGVISGSPTECALLGENCLIVEHEHMEANFARQRTNLWAERSVLATKYDETLTIATEVQFSAQQLDESNVFQLIRVIGMGPLVDVEIDEFNLYLPPASSFPLPGEVCDNMSPVNRDAEAGTLSPFPFYASHSWLYITVEEDSELDGNHFFKVRGRANRSVERSGIAWEVNPDCLHEGAYLLFRANVRQPVGSEEGSLVLKPRIRAELMSGEILADDLADCPLVQGSEWTKCVGSFIVAPEFIDFSVMKLEIVLGATSKAEYDIDDISLTLGGSDPNTLILDSGILGKWGPGAEVLITSHTSKWDGEQIRQIREVWEHDSDPKLAKVKLDSPITRPTTLLDSPQFAVEVGLLSRNIVFDSGPDPNPRHGGHFWVIHTPKVNQQIEGCEFRGMGQQGTLGRYPVHFHFCGDNDGSIVRRNTVRDSHQRAIVVHGTNKLTVEGNVVYNTKGHAIILEDGIETDNWFIDNLGARTGAVDTVIPDDGFNGAETDHIPSTFWISNPSNHFKGNVAAGSQSSGFWLELRLRGRKADQYPDLNPKTLPLGLFQGNTAHSNFRGLRTYPRGFVPDETANLIGFSSYKNTNMGLFMHQTNNLAIVDSVFADQGVGIDFDRADFISVTNTSIFGRTELYREIEDFQGAPSVCNNKGQLVGMDFHTFVRDPNNIGAAVHDVTFSGFESGICSSVAHIKLDEETRLGTFDWYSTLEQVVVEDRKLLLDFCSAEAVGVTDSYLIDLDGNLRPFYTAEEVDTPGTIVNDSANLKSFLDPSQCYSNGFGCNAYCDACFRTVRYDTSHWRGDDFLLEVCADETCITIEGVTDPEKVATDALNKRIFNAHLPHRLSYTAAFVSKDDNTQEVWPTFVVETYEDQLCPDSFEDGAVHLMVPTLAPTECNELIQNGEIQNLDRWVQRGGGLVLLENAGVAGSLALSDVHQTDAKDSISQYLDTRCFTPTKQGASYEVEAWVKLVDPQTGDAQGCHLDGKGCPEVRIVTSALTKASVATLVPHHGNSDNGEFQLLHGVLDLDEALVTDSTIVEFVVQRNRKDLSLQVDDVSMALMPGLTLADDLCSLNLVENADFEQGDAKFWSRSSADMEIVETSSGYGLELSNGGSAQGFLKAACFEVGERYEVLIEYKIVDGNDQVVQCDPLASSGAHECPSAKVQYYQDGTFLRGQRVVNALASLPGEEWSTLYGLFTTMEQADRMLLQMDDFRSSNKYILNSAVVLPKPKACHDNVLVNSNMGMGLTSFWSTYGSGSATWISTGYNDDDGDDSGAMFMSDRSTLNHGVKFNAASYLDPRCLIAGSEWEIVAQMQLFNASTGQPASCNVETSQVQQGACPAVRVEIKDSQNVQVLNEQLRQYNTNEHGWNAGEWNEFRSTLTLPSSGDWDGSVSNILIQIRSFSTTLDAIIDEFMIRQTG